MGDEQPSVGEADDIGPLALSKTEQQVLQLYDKLMELQLESALLKARGSSSLEASPQDIPQAQEEVLAARLSYTYTRHVDESLLITNPTLMSVHDATNASPIEKNILAYIRSRDSASAAIARQSNELRSVLDETARVHAESLRVARANVIRASELLHLAEDAKARKLGAASSQEMERLKERARSELKESRQKWKVVKGTASAVVVGSGVDWASDPGLRAMVLDPDDED